MAFLIDFGSSHSFLSSRLAQHLSGLQKLPKQQRVRIAGGGQLLCTHMVPKCKWSIAGHHFLTDFKILPLKHYDGIIGMDWLAARGTMQVNWDQKWLSFDHKGTHICLQGPPPAEYTCTMVEIHLVREGEDEMLPDEITAILEQFGQVFSEPTELPPRRSCDHKIPLMEGARPVNVRAYRYSPNLKSEIEKQIKEMLRTGIISPSNSAFASPIIMVKKKNQSWRLCVDYRHLNLITLKRKYQLPVIDELLDELSGASWFSKLDLRAGYHQIRLAPGKNTRQLFIHTMGTMSSMFWHLG